MSRPSAQPTTTEATTAASPTGAKKERKPRSSKLDMLQKELEKVEQQLEKNAVEKSTLASKKYDIEQQIKNLPKKD